MILCFETVVNMEDKHHLNLDTFHLYIRLCKLYIVHSIQLAWTKLLSIKLSWKVFSTDKNVLLRDVDRVDSFNRC